jgi:hypothetical protein
MLTTGIMMHNLKINFTNAAANIAALGCQSQAVALVCGDSNAREGIACSPLAAECSVYLLKDHPQILNTGDAFARKIHLNATKTCQTITTSVEKKQSTFTNETQQRFILQFSGVFFFPRTRFFGMLKSAFGQMKCSKYFSMY